MYGRKYTVAFSNITVTAIQDLLEMRVPGDLVMVLHEIKITQSTEAGDAEAEQLRFEFKRGANSTSGTGGASATPAKHMNGDASSTVSCERNNTTQAVAGGGSLDLLFEIDENVVNGLHYLPTPEARLVFSPNSEFILSLPTAPDDSTVMSGYAVFEEIGG